jgi:hypothetical protein
LIRALLRRDQAVPALIMIRLSQDLADFPSIASSPRNQVKTVGLLVLPMGSLKPR